MEISQNQALIRLMALEFQVLEMALFLDTHKNDAQALATHTKYATELAMYKLDYQKKYGPITIEATMKDSWAWGDDPWPWDINFVGGIK